MKDLRLISRQLRWHFAFVIHRIVWLLGAVIFHFLLGVFSSHKILEVSSISSLATPHIGDGLFWAFAGPGIGDTSLIPLLTLLLTEIFFLLSIGDLVYGLLGESDYVIVLAAGSRRAWWLSISATIIFTAIGYVIVILIATLAGITLQLDWNTAPSPFFAEQSVWEAVSSMPLEQVTLLIFSATASSLAVAGFIQTLVALQTRRTIWGILVVLLVSLVAWLVGIGNSVLSWQQWLPGTQLILSRHSPFEFRFPGFTAAFSLTYNTVLIVVLILGGLLFLQRFDFLGSQNDN